MDLAVAAGMAKWLPVKVTIPGRAIFTPNRRVFQDTTPTVACSCVLLLPGMCPCSNTPHR